MVLELNWDFETSAMQKKNKNKKNKIWYAAVKIREK
jgi:hypothetical protein